MPSLEKKKEMLAAKKEKRDKLNQDIKRLQDEISKAEAQEVSKMLNELNLTPAEAHEILTRAKKTAVNAGEPQQLPQSHASGEDERQ